MLRLKGIEMKIWRRVVILTLVGLASTLTFSPLASNQSSADEFKWENHKVIGSGRTSVGKMKYKLVWKEPHLLEGTARHEITPFLKPKSSCTWRFSEDFGKICCTTKVPMGGNPNYELIRVDKTKIYKGVWKMGSPMGKWEMTLAIYPDRVEGSGGGKPLSLKIIPPLSPEEVPLELQFIFEEDVV
jgi:hypothetical protein